VNDQTAAWKRNATGTFTYDACLQAFITKQSLQLHQFQKHEISSVADIRKLTPCTKSHQSPVLSRTTNSFKCSMCSKTFASERGMHMHVTRLHRSRDTDNVADRRTTKSVECSICAKRFASQHCLQVHFARQHKCANTAFDDVSSQRKHGTGDAECVGTKKSASTFKCDVCSETYFSVQSLSMHQTRQHRIKSVADVGNLSLLLVLVVLLVTIFVRKRLLVCVVCVHTQHRSTRHSLLVCHK